MDPLDKENIKEAFLKVKKDIDFLNNDVLELKIALNDAKDAIKDIKKNIINNSTFRHINTTNPVSSTQTSTVRQEIEGLKTQNFNISTGNRGVSTDRQTDTSTDTSTDNLTEKPLKNIDSNLEEASEILQSLDHIKKEIRLKFRHLTTQEMAVFSTIYQLEDQAKEVTYNMVSKTLKLSESSIRDYVQRIINKGITINKHKINNKKIIISISPELKKIVSLPAIIQLREL